MGRLPARWRAWADRPLGDRRERLLLLVGFALLVAGRLPRAWRYGRFVDEEGTIFFAYAWHRPALAALFRSFGGYLNLAANATALLAARLVRAGVLPLERAPYLTMALALAFELLPAVLILTGRAAWLANRRSVVVALLVVAAGPMTEEVFVNVLHIQFHLALCVALILALDVPASRWGRAAYALPLVLAPLCGPAAIVLLPLFALRALVDRDRGRLVQAVVLGAGAAVQLLLFFTPSPVRGHFLPPAVLASVLLIRFVAMPFGSAALANAIGAGVYHSIHDGGIGWYATALLALAWFAGLAVLAWRARRYAAVWLFAAGLLIAAISFGGGMIVTDSRDWFSVGAGERYNFLPLALFGWLLVALAAAARGRLRRVLWVLIGLTLVSGAISYATPLRELSRGPAWPEQVARWRVDHDRPLATWPGDWWVDLSDRDRPCSPARIGRAAPADPTYCESVWLARVADHVVVDPLSRRR